ncbi:glycosyltransferase family 2 protein [Natranaerobius trueperi]|uniref:glycosyltransferase family 2 protein n=1 Tax=Natranaerobius trueperi TaxID=759412 RepID=UPI003B838407
MVVDDGSTDNTKEIVEKFKAPYSLTFIYNKENTGNAAHARNQGIDIAKGNI